MSRARVPESCSASFHSLHQSCLVVVDMQTSFCDARGELTLVTLEHNPPGVVKGCFDNIKRLLSNIPFGLVVWTLDTHPADHVSFTESRGTHAELRARRFEETRIEYQYNGTTIIQQLYPSHCVIGTKGPQITQELASLAPPWDTPWGTTSGELVNVDGVAAEAQTYFCKGFTREVDANSAVFENDDKTEVRCPNRAGDKTFSLTEILRARQITHVYVVGVAADICVKSTCVGLARMGFRVCAVEDATLPFLKGQTPSVWAAGGRIQYSGGAVSAKVLTTDQVLGQLGSKSHEPTVRRPSLASVRQLHSNLSFKLVEEALPLVQQGAIAAGKELANNSQPPKWLSKAIKEGQYFEDLVGKPACPRNSCFNAEARKPIREEEGTKRRVKFGRVLPHDGTSASPYAKAYVPDKQRIAALADVWKPFMGSTGLNLVLLWPAKGAATRYGEDRVNVFSERLAHAKGGNCGCPRCLLQETLDFRNDHALALLDLLRQALRSAFQLSAGNEGLVVYYNKPETKALADDTREANSAVVLLLAVLHDQTLHANHGGRDQAEILYQATGWGWRTYFQTFVNSAQDRPAPNFSVCSPHFQCLFYPQHENRQKTVNDLARFLGDPRYLKQLWLDQELGENPVLMMQLTDVCLTSTERARYLLAQYEQLVTKVLQAKLAPDAHACTPRNFVDADDALGLLQSSHVKNNLAQEEPAVAAGEEEGEPAVAAGQEFSVSVCLHCQGCEEV